MSTNYEYRLSHTLFCYDSFYCVNLIMNNNKSGLMNSYRLNVNNENIIRPVSEFAVSHEKFFEECFKIMVAIKMVDVHENKA